MMAVVVTLGLAAAQPASAELEVTLQVPTATLAPARLVLTASVTGDDPVLEYAWEGLDRWPPCTGPTCELDEALTACRSISVEVTGLSGREARAEAQVCTVDEGGAPPEAYLIVQEIGGGVRISRRAVAGADAVLSTHLFVDDAEIDEPFAFLEGGAGCHTVTLLVVDAAGRFGQETRSVCLSASAPRVWLGAERAAITADEQQSLCASLRHPLGLPVTLIDGLTVPEEGCAPSMGTPTRLRRRVIAVEDSAGEVSFGGVVVARAPDQGPRTLPWIPRPESALNFGQSFPVFVAGGATPFEVEFEVRSDQGDVFTGDVRPGSDPRRFTLRLPRAPLDPGSYRLVATVTDARGLGTSMEAPVTRAIGGPDAGVGFDGGPGPAPAADLAACTATPAEGLAPLLLFGLFALAARRRRP